MERAAKAGTEWQSWGRGEAPREWPEGGGGGSVHVKACA